MNFDKKINETASRLGMVPGDSRRWDYDPTLVPAIRTAPAFGTASPFILTTAIN